MMLREKRQNFRREIRKRQHEEMKQPLREKAMLQNSLSTCNESVLLLHQIYFSRTMDQRGLEALIQRILVLIRENSVVRKNFISEVIQLQCLSPLFKSYGDVFLPLIEILCQTDNENLKTHLGSELQFGQTIIERINILYPQQYQNLAVRYVKIFNRFGNSVTSVEQKPLASILRTVFKIPFPEQIDLVTFVGHLCRLLYYFGILPLKQFKERVTYLCENEGKLVIQDLNRIYIVMYIDSVQASQIVYAVIKSEQDDQKKVILVDQMARNCSFLYYEDLRKELAPSLKRVLEDEVYQTNSCLREMALKIMTNLLINCYKDPHTISLICQDITIDLISALSFDPALKTQFQYLLANIVCITEDLQLFENLASIAKRLLSQPHLDKKIRQVFSKRVLISEKRRLQQVEINQLQSLSSQEEQANSEEAERSYSDSEQQL